MANETLSTSITGIIPLIYAESQRKWQQVVGIMDLARIKDSTGKPGKTLEFPKYGEIDSSDVATLAEGVEQTANVELTNTAVSATVERKQVTGFISDLADMSAIEDVVNEMSDFFVNATKAKLEDDVVNLFSTFAAANDLAGAGVTMTVADFYLALERLKTNNANLSRVNSMLSPKQYWGSKGLRSLIVSANVDSGELGEEMKNKGAVSDAFGIRHYISNEIDQDVASGGDAAGGIFIPGAIGIHTKNMFNIQLDPKPRSGGFDLVCQSYWKAVVIEDTWGCYFLSDVS